MNLSFYLHNNPSPPVGDTSSHPILPMDSDQPTAFDLYNYDTDRDTWPGLVIAKGGSGPDEGDPAKYQAWQTPVFSEALVIQGDATVHLWSGMKDFNLALDGAVSVYLRDFDGASYAELGSQTVTGRPWQGGSSWKQDTFRFSVGTYTVAPGHRLELKVIVEASSEDDMWFAYDTNSLKSRLTVSASAQAAVFSTLPPRLLACWLPQALLP